MSIGSSVGGRWRW